MEIKLKKLELSDAKDLQKVINNKEIIRRLDDENIKYPFTLADAKKYIRKSLKDKNTYEFGIIFKNKFVGTVVLENPNQGKKAYEVGYCIAKEYWGKGIATKAVKKIVRFGFSKLKAKRIWAGVLSNNPASARVLEKTVFS